MASEELDWFYTPGPLEAGALLELPPEEARHAVQSLRLKPTDALVLTNGRGQVARARVAEVTRRALVAELLDVRTTPLPATRLWLAPAIVRGPRFDFVIEKATELGLAGFVPLITRHSEVRPGAGGEKPERWRRLMVAALKQSRQAWLPELLEPTRPEEIPSRFPGARLCVAHPEPEDGAGSDRIVEQGHIPVTSTDLGGETELLLTGPEGGWHPEELAAFAAAGARFVHLGETRLRAETAALTLLAWALGVRGVFRSRGTP